MGRLAARGLSGDCTGLWHTGQKLLASRLQALIVFAGRRMRLLFRFNPVYSPIGLLFPKPIAFLIVARLHGANRTLY